MIKTILKEAGIVILLLIAIALVLRVILNGYLPSDKTVPAKLEAYTFPEDVQAELNESLQNEDQNIVRTYYIDSDDLSLYEYKQEYNKGKVNPFAEVSTGEGNDTSGNTAGGTGTNTTSTGNVTSSQQNVASGEFYTNKAGKY